MDSPSIHPQKPSVSADVEPVSDEHDIHPAPDLPFEDREPGLVDYQPDLGGAIQGE